jgi:hypothetical protein
VRSAATNYFNLHSRVSLAATSTIISFACMQTYNLSIITIEDSIASIKSKLQQIINIGSVFDSTSFGGRKTKVYFHSNSDIGSKVWNSIGMVETLLNSNMTKLLL